MGLQPSPSLAVQLMKKRLAHNTLPYFSTTSTQQSYGNSPPYLPFCAQTNSAFHSQQQDIINHYLSPFMRPEDKTSVLKIAPETFNTILDAAPTFAAPHCTPTVYQILLRKSPEEFFESNHLVEATISHSTQSKYATAINNFRLFLAECPDEALGIDEKLASYIQLTHLKDPRPDRRQEMSNLLCMILLMLPNLKQELGLSRKCIQAWRRLKPSQCSAPLTREMAFAFSWSLIQSGIPEAAAVLLLSHAAFLRVFEALKLQWDQFAFPGDVRIASYGSTAAGINIVDAKTSRSTGRLQFVPIYDPHVIKFLEIYRSTQTNSSSLVKTLSYPVYLKAIKNVAKSYNLYRAKFTTHSARIGKATEQFVQGKSVEQIAIHGRWKSLNSLKYYVDNGRSWLSNIQITQQDQLKLRKDAARLINITSA